MLRKLDFCGEESLLRISRGNFSFPDPDVSCGVSVAGPIKKKLAMARAIAMERIKAMVLRKSGSGIIAHYLYFFFMEFIEAGQVAE